MFPSVLYLSCCMVFFLCYVHHRDLHGLTHSVPTRLSSDLQDRAIRCPTPTRCRRCATASTGWLSRHSEAHSRRGKPASGRSPPPATWPAPHWCATGWPQANRSEEHTSELQSLMRISYAVFCLKKKTHTHITTTVSSCKHNKD